VNRIFAIWNRGYKIQTVIAPDPHHALSISLASGHFRKAGNYRKFQDVTDEWLSDIGKPGLASALKSGLTGVAVLVADGWMVGGQLIPI